MKRQIVYPGAIPLETDILNTNKNVMVGLGKLAAGVLGTGTVVNGLPCSPTAPASMQVKVGAGEIYSLQPTDSTDYSSLPVDTTAIVKQGISISDVLLSCPAPTTVGHSINYLIQCTYQDVDVDDDPAALPYYNASNPAIAYSGPNNSGASQATTRDSRCYIMVLSGASAISGTQVTPTATAGYTGLYVVTVSFGQTSITAVNISKLATMPEIKTRLRDAASINLPNTFTQVQTGVPAAGLNDFPVLSQVQGAVENIIDNLPTPVIQGANVINVTGNIVSGTGGTVSVPAGVYFSLCREITAGVSAVPSFVQSTSWTSPNLAASSTYFLRCQFSGGAPVFYVQSGALTDSTPASRKGTINGVSGGGFFSTPIDICIAMVVTGANGTLPTIRKINNLARNEVSAPILNGTGTYFFPLDPLVKSATINAGVVVPHASLMTTIVHGGTGWIGGSYANFLPQGISQPIQQAQNNTWAGATGGNIIGSNNNVGDTFNSTSDAILDHISGRAYWKTYHAQHKNGDTSSTASFDELLLAMGQKNIIQVDYDSGWPIAYANCVNATMVWRITR